MNPAIYEISTAFVSMVKSENGLWGNHARQHMFVNVVLTRFPVLSMCLISKPVRPSDWVKTWLSGDEDRRYTFWDVYEDLNIDEDPIVRICNQISPGEYTGTTAGITLADYEMPIEEGAPGMDRLAAMEMRAFDDMTTNESQSVAGSSNDVATLDEVQPRPVRRCPRRDEPPAQNRIQAMPQNRNRDQDQNQARNWNEDQNWNQRQHWNQNWNERWNRNNAWNNGWDNGWNNGWNEGRNNDRNNDWNNDQNNNWNEALDLNEAPNMANDPNENMNVPANGTAVETPTETPPTNFLDSQTRPPDQIEYLAWNPGAIMVGNGTEVMNNDVPDAEAVSTTVVNVVDTWREQAWESR